MRRTRGCCEHFRLCFLAAGKQFLKEIARTIRTEQVVEGGGNPTEPNVFLVLLPIRRHCNQAFYNILMTSFFAAQVFLDFGDVGPCRWAETIGKPHGPLRLGGWRSLVGACHLAPVWGGVH